MTKFKNKKTGKVVEEHLLYYVEKLKNDSNYEEVKTQSKSETKENKDNKNNKEVGEEKPLQ